MIWYNTTRQKIRNPCTEPEDLQVTNFVVTGGTGRCHADDVRTSDDKIVTMKTVGFSVANNFIL